jgi:cysteine dioxygenase
MNERKEETILEKCCTCQTKSILEEGLMQKLGIEQFEERQSKNEKKELNQTTLTLFELQLIEALQKSNDIEKKRENVILALNFLDPCQFIWDKYYNFIDKGYTRNLVIENELFELIILCWDKECQTPIHDHPSDGCWMTGIEGQLTETKFKKTSEESLTSFSHSTVHQGEIVYIHDYIGLHSIRNDSKEQRAVTLHLYSPPIRKCCAYQENGCKVDRTLKYYSKNCKKI